jgi:hypothetical protein
LAREPIDAHLPSTGLQDRVSFFGRHGTPKSPNRKHFTTDSVLANHMLDKYGKFAILYRMSQKKSRGFEE